MHLIDTNAPPPKPLLIVPADEVEWFRKHVELAGDFAIVSDGSFQDYDG